MNFKGLLRPQTRVFSVPVMKLQKGCPNWEK